MGEIGSYAIDETELLDLCERSSGWEAWGGGAGVGAGVIPMGFPPLMLGCVLLT